ncbi:MAG: helix-turn-helix domain-containing protein [Haloferacaceae archaeon]
MKSLRCTLRFDEAVMHPVHRRLTNADAPVRDFLLHERRAEAGPDTLFFYVEGDRETYRAALEAAEPIREYDITPLSEGTCYAYVREATTEFDVQLRGAFDEPGLLVIPPVEFRSDGTARLTAVGEPGTLQTAVEEVPGTVRVDVERIGEYASPPAAPDPGAGGELTERQRAAVAAAVDVGYYDIPRTGSVAAVADRLGCAPGTAAEHLRKAERTVMAAAVDRSPDEANPGSDR